MPIPIAQAKQIRENAQTEKRKQLRAEFLKRVNDELDEKIVEFSRKEMSSMNIKFNSIEVIVYEKRFPYPEGVTSEGALSEIKDAYKDYVQQIDDDGDATIVHFAW